MSVYLHKPVSVGVSQHLLLQALTKKSHTISSPENAVDQCVWQHSVENASANEGEARRIVNDSFKRRL